MTTPRKPKAARARPVAAAVETAPDVEFFHFRLRADVDPETAIAGLQFGHSPRVSLKAGMSYATPDRPEAARLRRVAELEEVTA